MTTLVTIILLFVFLRVVWAIFRAGLRILGWMLGSLGFLISLFLAFTVVGVIFHLLPVLLIVGLLMAARQPV